MTAENRIRELRWGCGINDFRPKNFYPVEAAFRLECATFNPTGLVEEKPGRTAHQTPEMPRAQLLASCAAIGPDRRAPLRRRRVPRLVGYDGR